MYRRLAHLSSFFVVALIIYVIAGQIEASEGQKKGGPPPVQALDPQGIPKDFKKGLPARYAVWHKKDSWHVRTTTEKVEHFFTGNIVVEGGVITGVESHDLEHKGAFADWWKVHDNKQSIAFSFKTDRGIDGINFQVSKEAVNVHFNLHVDGQHQKDRIFIGKGGLHPDRDPFTLVAHPAKAAKKKG